MAQCTEQDGQVLYQRKWYVPEGDQLRLRLIQEHHNSTLAGHPARAKTFDVLDGQYCWKEKRKQVDQYIRKCHDCQRSRKYETCNVGSPPTPICTSETIGKYFDGLFGWATTVLRLDTVSVVVDRLSRMSHFVPCHTTIDAAGLAKSFVQEVLHPHDLPKTIISDWGPQFASTCWGQIYSELGIGQQISMVFHAPMDDQTERINAAMEPYLRALGNHQQHDWVQWLPQA